MQNYQNVEIAYKTNMYIGVVCAHVIEYFPKYYNGEAEHASIGGA